jgi:hypothetical protein
MTSPFVSAVDLEVACQHQPAMIGQLARKHDGAFAAGKIERVRDASQRPVV